MKIFSKKVDLKTTPRQVAEIAYLAGLLDGEGTIQTKKEMNHGVRTSYKLWVSIRLVTEEPLREMCELFGGSLYYYDSKNPKWRGAYVWTLGYDAVEELLKLVFPYLRLKKRQAALAFKFREVIRQTLRSKDKHRLALRDDVMREMAELNRRGTRSAVETVRATPQGDDPVRTSEKSEEVLQGTA